jgi:hypothetical protein
VTINPISRLKTLTGFNAGSVINNLSAIDDDKLRGAYNRILENYGPLALAELQRSQHQHDEQSGMGQDRRASLGL